MAKQLFCSLAQTSHQSCIIPFSIIMLKTVQPPRQFICPRMDNCLRKEILNNSHKTFCIRLLACITLFRSSNFVCIFSKHHNTSGATCQASSEPWGWRGQGWGAHHHVGAPGPRLPERTQRRLQCVVEEVTFC